MRNYKKLLCTSYNSSRHSVLHTIGRVTYMANIEPTDPGKYERSLACSLLVDDRQNIFVKRLSAPITRSFVSNELAELLPQQNFLEAGATSEAQHE